MVALSDLVNAPNVQPFLPGNRHSCPECCTLTGKYPSKLLLEPIVMHRFCKFRSKVGSVSRAKPSPDHTGNKLEVGQTFSVFPFRSILRLIYDQKRWRF